LQPDTSTVATTRSGVDRGGRLHVLHVSMPTTEGTAVVALGYIRHQLARGWRVTVACPSEGWLGYEARELGATVRWWEATRDPGVGVVGECLALSGVLADTAPHLVHLHSAKAGLVGRLVVRRRVPVVYQPHGWSFLAATGAKRAASLRWERWATTWTDELICVSEAERQLGLTAGIEARTSVLPNGVDLAVWQPRGAEERSEARERLDLDQAPLAVCVGRLARQKGQHDLLGAWPEVRAAVPDAQLMLVGDGPDREDLERAADATEGVRFVGSRSDVADWLTASNVVVVPSLWEGMALVPLEAMATARSVVATNVAGIVESVPEVAGAIVTPGDRAAIAEALARRLADPEEADSEGLEGRSHVETDHDAASSAKELARSYLRVLALRRRGR
jgi:glycosyltransferase involved in cell wall biosynthesis